ncbi:TetR/AcrR family transcriptional regulator [Gordonia sp. CPCC 205515]|uniref:TetR/AcrR family transcriptional regulator n=1 Tax=Gordonia sp. CPCC 205515 TaxID=3140791 RepID=UPI003AF37612
MPSSKPTRRARPADRKRQLADHAAALFAQRGYPQVSVADVARAAGVTAPSVYRHFADKQALLMAAVMAGVDDLETCTDRALANGTAPSADLIAAVCKLGVQRPQSTSLWRLASQHLTEEQNREVVLRVREILHRWATALSDDADISEREAVELAWAVLSVAGSLSVHNTRIPTSRAFDEIDALVRRVIALQPDSAPPLPPIPPAGGGIPTRRDEILDAAAQLFAARGYSGVGVDEIGAAVGITGPSVYKHFSSKLSILLGIGQRSGARLEAGVMAAYATTSDPAKLLDLLVDSYVSVITSTPDLSVGFNNAYALAGQATASDLLDVQRRYVGRWMDLLMAADPEATRARAGVAVHASLSIVNDAIRMRRGISRPDFAGRMAYLMKGVLGI